VAGKIYEPEHYAKELLASLGLSRIQNLNEILHALKLKVVEKDLTSVDGILIRKSGKGIIAVKRSVKEIGRKNFTICHEIGHYILPKHGSVTCKSDEIDSWKSNLSPYEIEANKFASELLLPTKVIFPLVEKKKATLTLVKEIANSFHTSLTATALKCVAVTEEKCAVVWSVNGQIQWCKPNENFKSFIPKRQLDSDSLAYQLIQTPVIQEKSGSVYAEAWIDGDSLTSNDKIWEDSIHLPTYKGVLTILTLDA
jgi:Zn-dependent peptidase ImmA (M78 family)